MCWFKIFRLKNVFVLIFSYVTPPLLSPFCLKLLLFICIYNYRHVDWSGIKFCNIWLNIYKINFRLHFWVCIIYSKRTYIHSSETVRGGIESTPKFNEVREYSTLFSVVSTKTKESLCGFATTHIHILIQPLAFCIIWCEAHMKW